MQVSLRLKTRETFRLRFIPGISVDPSAAPVKAFPTGEFTPIGERFSRVLNLQDDCGAKLNNIDSDDAAWSKVEAETADSDYPIKVVLNSGISRLDGSPNLRRTVVEGMGERQSIISLRGGATINFAGVGTRVAAAGLRNLMVEASTKTSGFAVSVDWAQDVRFENLIFADVFSGVSIRQAGDTTFLNVGIENLRGGYGIYAIGPRGTRNGELDKIDVIDLKTVTIEGTYTPGVNSPIGTGFYVDGMVHTIEYDALRILNLNEGLVSRNTYGHAQEYAPSFLQGRGLQAENTWKEGIRLEAMNEFRGEATFVSTSVSESGIYLGSGCYDAKFFGGASRTNWKAGIYVAGAKQAEFHGYSAFNNNLAASTFAGLDVDSGDVINVFCGKYGKNNAITSYTENQAYGIKNNTGTFVRAYAADLRNNATGTFNGTVRCFDCPGVDLTPVNGSVGTSPYNRTAGPTPELWILTGGTGVVAKQYGATVASGTPATVYVPAGVAGTVEHSGTAPTITIHKL